MNKNLIITALLVAVSCQQVSAVSFFSPKPAVPTSMISRMYATITSFVKNHKVACGAALAYGLYKIYSIGNEKCRIKSSQQLLVDVKKAVDGQKKYITPEEIIACDDLSKNWYGELDSRNYPCVDKSIVQSANQYIFKKNLLLKSGRSRQEMLELKKSINMILREFKKNIDQQTTPRGHMTVDEIEAGFKEITDSLKLQYETLS